MGDKNVLKLVMVMISQAGKYIKIFLLNSMFEMSELHTIHLNTYVCEACWKMQRSIRG